MLLISEVCLWLKCTPEGRRRWTCAPSLRAPSLRAARHPAECPSPPLSADRLKSMTRDYRTILFKPCSDCSMLVPKTARFIRPTFPPQKSEDRQPGRLSEACPLNNRPLNVSFIAPLPGSIALAPAVPAALPPLPVGASAHQSSE